MYFSTLALSRRRSRPTVDFPETFERDAVDEIERVDVFLSISTLSPSGPARGVDVDVVEGDLPREVQRHLIIRATQKKMMSKPSRETEREKALQIGRFLRPATR